MRYKLTAQAAGVNSNQHILNQGFGRKPNMISNASYTFLHPIINVTFEAPSYRHTSCNNGGGGGLRQLTCCDFTSENLYSCYFFVKSPYY